MRRVAFAIVLLLLACQVPKYRATFDLHGTITGTSGPVEICARFVHRTCNGDLEGNEVAPVALSSSGSFTSTLDLFGANAHCYTRVEIVEIEFFVLVNGTAYRSGAAPLEHLCGKPANAGCGYTSTEAATAECEYEIAIDYAVVTSNAATCFYLDLD